MNADGNLATAAESGESRALRSDGKARVGVVEEGNGRKGFHVAFANLDTQGSLAGGGAKIFRVEALANVVGFAQAVEAGGSEQDRVDLAFGELAQARIHVAAKLDGLNVLAQGLQLRAAALAAGAHARAARQLSEAARN